MTTLRDAVFPAAPHALYELHRYSPAIRSNGFLFVSGQVGVHKDGSAEADLAAQVRLAFENLNAILSEAGSSFNEVIDTTIFMVNPEANVEIIWQTLAQYWGQAPYPTVTAVGVTWLSGFDFEIKVIARVAG